MFRSVSFFTLSCLLFYYLLTLCLLWCLLTFFLLTWVSSTNCANCQGSMKHKLEMPRATMAVLLGFRVLWVEENKRGKRANKTNFTILHFNMHYNLAQMSMMKIITRPRLQGNSCSFERQLSKCDVTCVFKWHIIIERQSICAPLAGHSCVMCASTVPRKHWSQRSVVLI